jgi:hypothetical protein
MNFIQYRIPSKLLEMTRNININDKINYTDTESDSDSDSDIDENKFIPLNITSHIFLNNFNSIDNIYKTDINDIYDEELANIFSVYKPTIKKETLDITNKRTYNKKKIYKCNYCNKKYILYNNFKKHLSIHLSIIIK